MLMPVTAHLMAGVVSRWKKTLQHLEWDIEIPVNTFASVYLPNGKVEKVGSGKYHFSVDIPAADKCIVTDEFLYEDAGFPQCHGATVVELENGDLVAAFFGGHAKRILIVIFGPAASPMVVKNGLNRIKLPTVFIQNLRLLLSVKAI